MCQSLQGAVASMYQRLYSVCRPARGTCLKSTEVPCESTGCAQQSHVRRYFILA